ncbi:hypothetical protein CC86DRAFT_366799 [Ophiobolus disseminans]|uniref:Uncharacterized protein n=1 Tax=Ophiobolus disseminans TaxID=1469910 RepID=A0A6A7ADZ4_9PLEO|nr:hypothetical protein CC86DRAFT_366799 [Ophiobolus disseminans]
MAEPSPNPSLQPTEQDPTLQNGTPTALPDIEMSDPTPQQEQPAVQAAPTPVPQPPPVSSRNSPHPSAPAQQTPTQPVPHGSPTRVYLNQYVTPHLLEAMKHLATTEPDKPLKWLSEFLAMKSAELEG